MLRHRVTLLALIALSLTVAGCAPSEGLIPQSVAERVNLDGREHTYDTAWQNIRGLNGDLAREDYRSLTTDSQLVLSQMERLERGRASTLSGLRTSWEVKQFRDTLSGASREELLAQLRASASELQAHFDAGDFPAATQSALATYLLALALEGDSSK